MRHEAEKAIKRMEEKTMEADDRESVEMLQLPTVETGGIMKAMKQAEKAGDVEALRWCARRLLWLYKAFKDDTTDNDDPFGGKGSIGSIYEFNSKYKKMLKKDPAPNQEAAINYAQGVKKWEKKTFLTRLDREEPMTDADRQNEIEFLKEKNKRAEKRATKARRRLIKACEQLEKKGA